MSLYDELQKTTSEEKHYTKPYNANSFKKILSVRLGI